MTARLITLLTSISVDTWNSILYIAVSIAAAIVGTITTYLKVCRDRKKTKKLRDKQIELLSRQISRQSHQLERLRQIVSKNTQRR